MKVKKKSNKPFKSGNKINTVNGETININTGKPAYIFLEDGSVVDQYICVEVMVKKCVACNEEIEVNPDDEGQINCPICKSNYPLKFLVDLEEFEKKYGK